ncbi:uncharacterized protein (DUF2141 family) [Sphingobium xanthum]|uniref:DUF2141 domain-containing protein n=1 Tax=Sphingobium xanthum TaxID=1387165 RepID=UPI001C8B3899|nr:DUF2141 domain-containing protein [Sphingobium xanthum]
MTLRDGRVKRGAAVTGLSCLLLLQAGSLARASVPSAELGILDVRFEGLRSAKGYLRGCLTRNPAYYPKCEKDPAALRLSVAAGKDAHLAFGGVPPGDYAVLVLHDENGNNKVDTMLGIPREGVGFSRNPRIMFGPPRFDAVRIHVPAGPSATGVKLQYFL